MNALNTLPIEMFLEKSRIARKSGQKTLSMSINDAIILEECLAVVMTRMVGGLESLVAKLSAPSDTSVKMDGGYL
jgi:hypothetical protein